jgi:hypothetical protein
MALAQPNKASQMTQEWVLRSLRVGWELISWEGDLLL